MNLLVGENMLREQPAHTSSSRHTSLINYGEIYRRCVHFAETGLKRLYNRLHNKHSLLLCHHSFSLLIQPSHLLLRHADLPLTPTDTTHSRLPSIFQALAFSSPPTYILNRLQFHQAVLSNILADELKRLLQRHAWARDDPVEVCHHLSKPSAKST